MSKLPLRVGFVGINSEQGGALAAQAAAEYVNSVGLGLKRALVVYGESQIARQASFKKTLESLFPKVDVLLKNGCFDWEKSRELTRQQVSAAIAQANPFQIIFCTTDTMTLGAVQALEDLGSRTHWKGTPRPIIIGYDAIKATKAIRSDDGPLWRIIEQDAERVADETVALLETLIDGQDAERIVLIPPTEY